MFMKREFSAGGIVFKKEGDKTYFLLIENASMKDPNKKYWGFSKGHIDKEESSKDAAVREIREETGIEAEITEKVEDSKYVFTFEGERIFKVVSVYLMEAKGGQLNKQLTEISDIGWFDQDQVLERLSFSNDKKMFKKALEMLNG